MTPFALELEAMRARLGLTPRQLSQYLGVSYGAVRHWLVGSRLPDNSVRRLVQVLGMVEAMAPGLHAAMMPTAVERVPRKRRITRVAAAQSPDSNASVAPDAM